ncbi:hypothetical protein ACIQAL_10050 [Pseudomonas sp. NPDC088368]|uniref:hypothetical protein n=1 Tax=Pseudomonas sp. NPDC088368 TaxID=3364453 RepID=UPI00381D369E
MNSDLSPKALLEEKSLLEIYKKSRRIPFNSFNFWSTIIVVVMVAIQYCLLDISITEKLKMVREFSVIAVGITTTVLGFLLAGFTIFATISQPDMLVAMSQHREQKSGLSFLKYNFFIFMRVFIYYMAYAVFCVFTLIFAIKGGVIHYLVNISPISHEIIEWLLGFSYVALYGGMYFLLMQLKSFIYNVYHSVMTAIRWKASS